MLWRRECDVRRWNCRCLVGGVPNFLNLQDQNPIYQSPLRKDVARIPKHQLLVLNNYCSNHRTKSQATPQPCSSPRGARCGFHDTQSQPALSRAETLLYKVEYGLCRNDVPRLLQGIFSRSLHPRMKPPIRMTHQKNPPESRPYRRRLRRLPTQRTVS